MRAAVLFESPGSLRIEDVLVDEPGSREVVVRLVATGLCHSDLHHLQHGTYMALPMVLGHEGAGVVESVGGEVTYVEVGDHVISTPRSACGACEWCRSGRPTLCENAGLRRGAGEPPRLRLGDGRGCGQLSGLGTFAEKMLVHENALVKISKDVSLDRAALLGCGVVTGVGAVIRTAQVPPGANVAVIGCGGIGLNCIQGAAIAGANRIIAIDIDPHKLELATEFGATDAINNRLEDVSARLAGLLPGKRGVDFSFEALGREETCALGFSILRPGGTLTVIGLVDGVIAIPGKELLQERKVQGSMLGSIDFRRERSLFLDLYRDGRLRLDELISSRLELDEINVGFEALARGGVARSVIMFDQ